MNKIDLLVAGLAYLRANHKSPTMSVSDDAIYAGGGYYEGPSDSEVSAMESLGWRWSETFVCWELFV